MKKLKPIKFLTIVTILIMTTTMVFAEQDPLRLSNSVSR